MDTVETKPNPDFKMLTNTVDLNYGLFFVRTGAFKRGLPYLERALEEDPDNIHALIGKARAYIAFNDYDQALEFYNKAIELNEYNLDAIEGKGSVLLMSAISKDNNTEELEQAENIFKEAIDLYPTDDEERWTMNEGDLQQEIDLWHKLAVTQFNINDFEQSKKSYTKQLTLELEYAQSTGEYYCWKLERLQFPKKEVELNGN
jgi:tetratricopeptide (TPR) repeat protein